MTALAHLRPRHLAWLPAALLAAYTLAAAGGFTATPNSHAAATGQVTVTADVLKEIHLDLDDAACGTVAGPANAETSTINYGTMSTASDDILLGSCHITFGSNNNGTAGAKLYVESARTGGTASFCSVATATTSCSGATFTETATAGVAYPAAFTAAQGTFGLRPAAAPTCPGATADWGSANIYGLPQDTDGTFGTQICDTNSTADGDIVVQFRANPAAAQQADNYYMRALFTAEAT